MSRLVCIIIRKFSCTIFLRLEDDPQKSRKFSVSKIWRYTVDRQTDTKGVHLARNVGHHSCPMILSTNYFSRVIRALH